MSDVTKAPNDGDLSHMEYHTGTFYWGLSDVTELFKDKQTRQITSAPYIINGQPWCFRLQAKCESQYMGLYLVYNGTTEVDAEVSLQLYGPEGGEAKAEKLFSFRFRLGIAQGFDKFAKRNLFSGTGVAVKAQVKVSGPMRRPAPSLQLPVTEVSTTVEHNTGTLLWTINMGKLPKETKKRYIMSPPNLINGEPWCLKLFPYFSPPVISSGATESDDVALFLVYQGTGEALATVSLALHAVGVKKVEKSYHHRFSVATPPHDWGYATFAPREQFVGREVTFTAQVEVCGAVTTCQHLWCAPTPARALTLNLERLLHTGEGADVLLKTPEEGFDPIAAHRTILVAQSPVFAAMFRHDVSERRCGEVLIEDLPAPALRAFVAYLYTEDLRLDTIKQHGEALLAAADKWQVPRLAAICEQHMMQHITIDNVVPWAELAYLHNAEGLKHQCQWFIQSHLGALKATEAWQQLLQQPEIMNDLIAQGVRSSSPILQPNKSPPKRQKQRHCRVH